MKIKSLFRKEELYCQCVMGGESYLSPEEA